jgi:hypothetical protein
MPHRPRFVRSFDAGVGHEPMGGLDTIDAAED